MTSERKLEELLCRIEILEEKVELLSCHISEGYDEEGEIGKEKRCLPGFNNCIYQ